MKFARVKSYKGGALGSLSKGITALQTSLERLRATTPIILRPENNSACIEFYGDSGGGGNASCTWSGVVWYLGNVMYDFNNTSNSPTGSASPYGMVGVEYDDATPPNATYRGSVLGEYLKIKLRDGTVAWVDGADISTSIADIDDKDEYEYFRVATISGDGYVLAENRTVGDIRINYAPYVAEIEEIPE